MGEPVEGRAGEPLAPQDLGPVLERQVGGDDETVAFVGRVDDVEQQLGARLTGRNVAQFVEDDQIELGQLRAELEQLLVIPSFEHQRDQFGDPKEPYLAAMQTGGQRERRGEMGLPRAAGADQQ